MTWTAEQKRLANRAKGIAPVPIRSAEYWKEYRARWRATNRGVENARKYRNRALRSPSLRDNNHLRAPVKPRLSVYERSTNHELFDKAREIVGLRKSTLTELYDATYDDHISAVVLALIEGSDPVEAFNLSKKFFTYYGAHTVGIKEFA